jgi:Uma2 family endonuclease
MSVVLEQPVTEYPIPFKWSRELYYAAVDAGIFGTETPVELIGGELVWSMSPQNSPHATAIRLMEDALRAAFNSGWEIRSQMPLALGLNSEPEPDVAVVAGKPRDYVKSHPTTAALVVEISDSTLRFDLTVKASLYASADIPEYWVVDLTKSMVYVHREPASDAQARFGFAYQAVTTVAPDGQVSPLSGPQQIIYVADVLP